MSFFDSVLVELLTVLVELLEFFCSDFTSDLFGSALELEPPLEGVDGDVECPGVVLWELDGDDDPSLVLPRVELGLPEDGVPELLVPGSVLFFELVFSSFVSFFFPLTIVSVLLVTLCSE